MAKVTAIIASPRKNGNCVAIVNKMAETLKTEGKDVEIFNINELDAKGCQACMGCKKAGKCVRKDGITPVLESIASSDSLILATPDYFGQSTSQYRMLEDRMYGFIGPDFSCALKPGMKLATVITAGSGAGADDIKASIDKVMVNYFKMEPVGSLIHTDAKNGPAKDNADVMAAAEALARKL